MLVLIAGYACTGKSTLRKYLEGRGILAIEASSFIAPLREECRKLGIDNIYEMYPKSIGAERIEQQYGERLSHAVVVGLRTVEEYLYFKERYPIKLVRLQASLSTCYIRSNSRPDREHYDSPESFYKSRIATDNALGLCALLARSEETILNEDCSQAEFFQCAAEKIIPLFA